MALTDIAVKNAKHSGKPAGDKHHDTGGLYLLVKAAGRYWRMDYRFGGKRKTLALGIYPAVSLVQARKGRDKARQLLEQGIDPYLHRRAEKLLRTVEHENSFQAVAMQWYEQWSVGKSPTTTAIIMRRLKADVFPAIGPLPITSITTPMLLGIVKDIASRGVIDTAARTLNTCSQIFRHAVANGVAERNPAADVRPSDVLPQRKTKNQSRISAKELPDLLRAIDAYDGRDLTRYAMQLMTLTFVRTSELIGARWEEIDLDTARWEIPAERMKMDSPHIVPLSRQAVEVLRQIQAITGRSEWVFPHDNNPKRHMSNNTILYALYRMGYKGRMTGHGFRGVASTILHEHGFDHAHIELQLSHIERDSVAAAYNHATYLKQRADLMQWWGDYVENCTRDNVLTLPRRA